MFAFLKRWLFGVPDLPIDQDELFTDPLYAVDHLLFPAEVKPARKTPTRKKKPAKNKPTVTKTAAKKKARKRHKAAE